MSGLSTKKLAKDLEPVLRECKSVISKLLSDATVILYGSAARGARSSESDLDIVTLAKHRLTPEEEQRLGDALYALELERGAIISERICSRDECDGRLLRGSPLRQSVEREGIPI